MPYDNAFRGKYSVDFRIYWYQLLKTYEGLSQVKETYCLYEFRYLNFVTFVKCEKYNYDPVHRTSVNLPNVDFAVSYTGCFVYWTSRITDDSYTEQSVQHARHVSYTGRFSNYSFCTVCETSGNHKFHIMGVFSTIHD